MPEGIGAGFTIAIFIVILCHQFYREGFAAGQKQGAMEKRLEEAERLSSGFPVKSGLVVKSASAIEGER